MPSDPQSRPRAVREPVQVYLEPDDSALLGRLSEELGLAKAEILRRGLRAFASEQGGGSPMLRFVAESTPSGWPPSGTAAGHDAAIDEGERAERAERGRRKRSPRG